MEVHQSKVEKNIHSALNFTNDGMNISAFWEKVLCADGHEINPIFIIENIIPLYDTSFNYCIIEESEWNYDKSLKVFYDISTNKIFIKSDTYEKAHNGNIKAKLKITRELCKYLQYFYFNFFKFNSTPIET